MWKKANSLKFCDFQQLQNLFYFEKNNLKSSVIELR